MNQNYRFMELSQFCTPLHWAAHGVVGGASAEAQGGKFGQGFISTAFTKAISTHGLLPGKQGGLSIERLAGHAVVGGTASEISGGKFANGAQTAAYGYLFNELGRNITITRTKDSVLYEKGGASVLVKNNDPNKEIPIISNEQVGDTLRLSEYANNQQVRVISGHRPDSERNHRFYGMAMDLQVGSLSSNEAAVLVDRSNIFHRVSSYEVNDYAVHADNDTRRERGRYHNWGHIGDE